MNRNLPPYFSPQAPTPSLLFDYPDRIQSLETPPLKRELLPEAGAFAGAPSDEATRSRNSASDVGASPVMLADLIEAFLLAVIVPICLAAARRLPLVYRSRSEVAGGGINRVIGRNW